MRVHELRCEQHLPGPPEEVFAFFAEARNLEAITPPLLRFRVVTPEPIEMRMGTLIQYRLHVHRIPLTWLTSIQAWDPPHRFVDQQIRGPYALWHHTHTFRAQDGGTIMTDVVHYAIGFGALGALAHRLVIRRDLDGIFAFRAARVPALLAGVHEPAAAGKGRA